VGWAQGREPERKIGARGREVGSQAKSADFDLWQVASRQNIAFNYKK